MKKQSNTNQKSFNDLYAEMNDEQRRYEEKYNWRKRKKECSLDNMYYVDARVADNGVSFEERMIMSLDVASAIDMLTESQRNAIIAIFYHGMTQRAYAKEIGISEQAVGQLISRALLKMKKYIEKL